MNLYLNLEIESIILAKLRVNARYACKCEVLSNELFDEVIIYIKIYILNQKIYKPILIKKNQNVTQKSMD